MENEELQNLKQPEQQNGREHEKDSQQAVDSASLEKIDKKLDEIEQAIHTNRTWICVLGGVICAFLGVLAYFVCF